MHTSSSPTRALVLAGGGAAGNAWHLGVLAGLADAGLDVTAADLIVGTSAGATAAAQLSSGIPPADLYASVLVEQLPPRPAAPGGDRPARRPSAAAYLTWSDELIRTSADAADMRRRMGAAALERDHSDGAAGARWRDIVTARLPHARWPERPRVLITAMDAATGEPVVFDRDSGVDLVDAVAASTSAIAPYPIGERRYLDGGYRRNENADLAAGCDVVLVLVPFGGRSRTPHAWGLDLATQVEELEAAGSIVVTVFPDDRSGDVFNANALDPATRQPAARGGYAQGRELAPRLAPVWG